MSKLIHYLRDSKRFNEDQLLRLEQRYGQGSGSLSTGGVEGVTGSGDCSYDCGGVLQEEDGEDEEEGSDGAAERPVSMDGDDCYDGPGAWFWQTV